MSIRNLIVQNLAVFSSHGEHMNTFRLMLISFRRQRFCRKSASGRMPAVSRIFRVNEILLGMLILFVFISSEGSAFGETGQKERIALLPFDNLSGDRGALSRIMPLVRSSLESQGFAVADEASLEAFMLRERIRCTGYIARETAQKMGQELGVMYIMVGSINSFSEVSNPVVGLSARVVRTPDGSIVWANHTSFTGEDFTKVLELGAVREIDKLAGRTVDELFEPLSVVPPEKEKEPAYRIAVMPFENESDRDYAGMIATYLFISQLFKNRRFDPAEFGEVRKLMINMRIRGKGEMDRTNSSSILEMAHVDGIIVGTVESYREERGNIPAEASICARLIDARKNRLLWSDCREWRGGDGIVVLDWGRLRSAEAVAFKAISKLVKGMEKVIWR